MPQLSKLQIRAKVLSVISEVKSLQYRNEEALQNLCGQLNEIDDKEAMFDIFLKEYIKLDEDDYIFCSCIIKNTVPATYITEKSLEALKSSLSDEYKYKIVQLLRVTGGDYNYSELPGYFENPQEVMDLETKRLLDSAVFNPESMLDFLDFVSAVSERDKSLLLKSLNIDYKGDVLANIAYPILYSDFSKEFVLQTIDVLCESKSSLAIEPFEYLIQVSDDEEIVNACKKGLKILKLAGATKEKAREYYNHIIKNSVPDKFYVTIPDGSGKQALLTTREHDTGRLSLAAVVISDLTGIVDCFGFFNISREEIVKIVKKFYDSEGEYIAPKEYIKSRLEYAHELNKKNKLHYPYEYICWKPMLYDIEPLNESLEEYAAANCNICEVSKQEVSDFMAEEATFRWFLTPADNEAVKQVTEDIYSLENIDVPQINSMLIDKTNDIFDEKNEELWLNRIYNLIYILRQNNNSKDADIAYTIIKNEELFTLLKQILIQRSIFNYFVALKENLKESFFAKNIFQKRSANENKYDVKKINTIIIELKRSWIDK